MTIEIVRNVFELEAAIARRRMEPTNAAATVVSLNASLKASSAFFLTVSSASSNCSLIIALDVISTFFSTRFSFSGSHSFPPTFLSALLNVPFSLFFTHGM